MDTWQLVSLLRDLAAAFEGRAGPARGPNAPARPGGPSEAEVTGIILRTMAAGYRELADALEAAG